MSTPFTSFERERLNPSRGFTPLKLRELDLVGDKRIPLSSDVTETKVFPCSPGYVSGTHSDVPITGCARWDCEDCGSRKRARLKHELMWVRQQISGQVWFVTLTFSNVFGTVRSFSTRKKLAISTVKRMQRSFWHELGKQYPEFHLKPRFKAVEPTKNKTPHFHYLLFGCPPYRQLWQDRFREIWRKVSSGSFQVDVKQARMDITSYMTKEMSKSFRGDPLEEFRTIWKRRYEFCGNVPRVPRVMKVYRAMGIPLADLADDLRAGFKPARDSGGLYLDRGCDCGFCRKVPVMSKRTMNFFSEDRLKRVVEVFFDGEAVDIWLYPYRDSEGNTPIKLEPEVLL